MKAKPKPPVKLPRAYIESLYVDRDAVLVNSRAPDRTGDRLLHAACIPCRTRQEAREIVRLHRNPQLLKNFCSYLGVKRP